MLLDSLFEKGTLIQFKEKKQMAHGMRKKGQWSLKEVVAASSHTHTFLIKDRAGPARKETSSYVSDVLHVVAAERSPVATCDGLKKSWTREKKAAA